MHRLESFDAVISNAGGCGSHLRHYANLFKDDATYAERAHAWDAKVRDVQEVLWEAVSGQSAVGGGPSRLKKVLGLTANGEPTTPVVGGTPPKRLTYDASCHLCHGQKVVNQPVELLKRLPGHDFVPLAESDWCCGAAGVYTMTQPDQAQILLDRKLTNVRAAKPDVIATANPGCMHQLNLACRADDSLRHVRVVHPVEVLAEACHAPDGS